jgi:acyl-CoA ligase (AMP-forming) (exosortase A-associated)
MKCIPEFTLHHLLLNSAQRRPQCTAIIDRQREYSYQELLSHTSRLARTLEQQGVKKGDRVGIYLEKSWESVVAILAVSQAGGVFVVINPLLKEAQIRHIMQNCGIKVLVAEAAKIRDMALPPVNTLYQQGGPVQQLPWARETILLEEVLNGPECGMSGTAALECDLATIIYTSGSTGLPKGIMLSQHNLVAGAQIVSTYLENCHEDRVLSLLPFSFDYGLNQLTTMLRVGGTLVLQRSSMPGDILRSLHQHSITGLAGVPPVWSLLLQSRRSLEQEPLPWLRYITNSGGMIPGPHLQELQELLPHTRIYLMYGLTEAFRSTYLPSQEVGRGPSCIGRPIPNTQVWVINSEGRECAPGEVGELVHRGPTVALGYWEDPDHTRAVFRPNPFATADLNQPERVVYSGDLVRRDKEGYFHFVGRRDELIKCEGYRVSPQEVEEILSQLPIVQETAVFGEKDTMTGERVVAVVSLKNGDFCTAEEIRQQCSKLAPHYLVPRIVHLRKELPKTPTGKIDRKSLKHEYEARD